MSNGRVSLIEAPVAPPRTAWASGEAANCDRLSRAAFWSAAAVTLAALLWSYAHTLYGLTREWKHDDNYSVGAVVPLAALYLLFMDRRKLAAVPMKPALAGLLVILLGQGARFLGLARMHDSAERYSLVVTLGGVVLLVGGWGLLSAVKYVLALLLLMVPFPSAVHNAISNPLQDLSTSGAAVVLELSGLSVSQEGHVLHVSGGGGPEVPVAVAEACSGLRMLTAFIFVSAVMAYIAHRPPWQKAVLLLSSVPIAITTNLIRLVVTAMVFAWTGNKLAERMGHDFAGWLMMPLAVVLLVAELWILGRIETPERSAT